MRHTSQLPIYAAIGNYPLRTIATANSQERTAVGGGGSRARALTLSGPAIP
jgi:hypothetical protein